MTYEEQLEKAKAIANTTGCEIDEVRGLDGVYLFQLKDRSGYDLYGGDEPFVFDEQGLPVIVAPPYPAYEKYEYLFNAPVIVQE